MRAIRRGETGPAVAEIRSILVGLELLEASASDIFDDDTDTRVRAFQQSRGIGVDGIVGAETWQALDGARWKLGARTLFHSVPDALVGEDVRALQERLLEMGFDSGRADGIYGARTARAVAQFQREVGMTPDGSCGPQTMKALRRLGRKVVGGRPQWLREAEAFRQSGPNLVGKTIVIDPGHGGGDDLGVVVPDGPLRWTEADLVFDVAARLEGRLAAAGMRVHLTRGPSPAKPMSGAERAELANSLGADLLISLHLDEQQNGRRGRGDLPLRHRQRPDVDRRRAAGQPGAARDRGAHRHAELPDPRQDVGAAAADPDASGTGGPRLPDLADRPRPAGQPALPRADRRGDPGRGAAHVLPGRERRADRLDRRPPAADGAGGAKRH